ncbi:MAG: hypothetical protein IPG06_14650 [Haliea sp.]|nr:hypothetical protein [Haliea sp.]
MQRVDLGQKPDIGILVVSRKGIGGLAAMVTDLAGFPKLLHQTGNLGPGEAVDLPQVVPDKVLVHAQAFVAELA